MTSIANIALSGISAAGLRAGVAANNVANLQSTSSLRNGQRVSEPYRAQEVVQSSLETGGVSARVQESDSPGGVQFDPANPDADADGFVQTPNVNLEKEMVDLIVAGYDFRANLKVLKANDALTKSLLDIVA